MIWFHFYGMAWFHLYGMIPLLWYGMIPWPWYNPNGMIPFPWYDPMVWFHDLGMIPLVWFHFHGMIPWYDSVLYTPTACPTDSVGLSLDPAISDGLSRQSIGSLSESVGHDWIPLLVQPKSSESPLKPLRSKKWLDWLEFCVCWTSARLPLDFWWTEAETSHIC